uniref:Uncharacterized protein n=1 Tax=Romanomermis culicivorax TaxID=13658 RepID=A0A915KSB8_ROMCU
MSDGSKSTSSKNAGIRTRWKIAVKSVAAIGFKKFEGLLVKNDDKHDNDSTTNRNKMDESYSTMKIRKHSFQIMEQEFDKAETILECDVCHDGIETKYFIPKQTEVVTLIGSQTSTIADSDSDPCKPPPRIQKRSYGLFILNDPRCAERCSGKQ